MIGGEHMINISGEVHINDALVWRYERRGSYVFVLTLKGCCEQADSWKHDISWVHGQVIVWVKGLVVSFV